MSKQVWLITGCSSGFGEEIAKAALSKGQEVVASARGDVQKRLASLKSKGATVISLDVTHSQEELNKVIEQIIQEHKRIDVLVNNAGMAQIGCLEELDDSEWKAQFEINLFGLIRITRAVLPYMRRQRSGTICNIGSVAGRLGFAQLGAYCATKFAVEAITESLSEEVKSFNIRCIVIEPGAFRTEIMGSSNLKFPKVQSEEAYPEGASKDWGQMHQTQRGDTAKGGQVIVDALLQTEKSLPLRLALGPDAVEPIIKMANDQLTTIKEWEKESSSTDF